MEKFNAFYDFMKKFSKYISIISLVGLSAAVLFATVDIGMRFLFNKPIIGSYEIFQLILVLTVFASFAYTQATKGHINVTILLNAISQKPKFIIYSITSLLSTIVSGAVCWAAFRQMNSVMISNYLTAQHKIPYYPFYAYEGVMMAIFTIVLLLDTVQSVIAIFRKDYAESIENDWV